jgi:hypothetical protein
MPMGMPPMMPVPQAKPTPVPTPKPVVVEQTTVYVGKIPPTVEDEFIRKLLEVCGVYECYILVTWFIFIINYNYITLFYVVVCCGNFILSASLPPEKKNNW